MPSYLALGSILIETATTWKITEMDYPQGTTKAMSLTLVTSNRILQRTNSLIGTFKILLF